jgi:hypothetical protein
MKEPKREKNRLQRRLMEARVRSHERSRVSATYGAPGWWLLSGMGRSSCCKSRVEARTRPQSTRKAPENSNKKLCDPKSQRARLAKCHGIRFSQVELEALREPKPVTLRSPGPLSYTPICDPHFCPTPPMEPPRRSHEHERTRVPAMVLPLERCLRSGMGRLKC